MNKRLSMISVLSLVAFTVSCSSSSDQLSDEEIDPAAEVASSDVPTDSLPVAENMDAGPEAGKDLFGTSEDPMLADTNSQSNLLSDASSQTPSSDSAYSEAPKPKKKRKPAAPKKDAPANDFQPGFGDVAGVGGTMNMDPPPPPPPAPPVMNDNFTPPPPVPPAMNAFQNQPFTNPAALEPPAKKFGGIPKNYLIGGAILLGGLAFYVMRKRASPRY